MKNWIEKVNIDMKSNDYGRHLMCRIWFLLNGILEDQFLESSLGPHYRMDFFFIGNKSETLANLYARYLSV